jgi:hypothetical protein
MLPDRNSLEPLVSDLPAFDPAARCVVGVERHDWRTGKTDWYVVQLCAACGCRRYARFGEPVAFDEERSA